MNRERPVPEVRWGPFELIITETFDTLRVTLYREGERGIRFGKGNR